MTTTKIRIAPNGQIRFIYNDSLRSLMEEGESVIKRASHVEPNAEGKWEVDMAPVGGPKFGPFETRKEALAEEVKWLESHGIPAPK
jgi:hypothetical protein